MTGGRTHIPLRSRPFAICFDFPEHDDPVFAGFAGDVLGFAPSLRTAVTFTDEASAERTLASGYGPETRVYGCVVEVDGG